LSRQAGGAGLLVLALLAGTNVETVNAAEEFGRLFTTPAQRQRLDELRKVSPEQRIKIDEQSLLLEEETEEVEEAPADVLTVRGLVHRSKGRNTAWINDSNSFEGGLSSQYIIIGTIGSDRVEILIPGSETRVKLNVGQSFDPIAEQYDDLLDNASARISTGKRKDK